ncbi:peroxisomal copper amine oxidase [Tilletia horrida]|nr:peroxisomal copper amine oxidase [Tilletia horrida]
MSPTKVTEATHPASTQHPLDPPTAQEVEAATSALRKWQSANGINNPKFVIVMLHEPPKADLLAALNWSGTVSKSNVSSFDEIERVFEVHFIDVLNGNAYEAYVDMSSSSSSSAATVREVKKLPEGVQPALTPEELCSAEQMIRDDPRVVKLLQEINVNPKHVYADGWSIGWDTRFGRSRRIQQCLLFVREHKDANLYASPLDFFPIVDNNTGELLAIDFPDHRTKAGGALTSGTTAPPTEISFEAPPGRERIAPPTQKHEYLPEFATTLPHSKTPDAPIELRKDLKPLSVVQPEGVSFKRTGNVLEWQRWKLHVGFHPREGIVLSTISYQDPDAPGASYAAPKERPLFYRLSLSEMVVPYGDPASPHYRKFAFDVGEYGLGFLANSLALGCDCLGSIEYMDGIFTRHDGTAEVVKNAICIHEEDTQITWKHTDFRVGGRGHAVRGRKLVISMACTVANYEYLIYWNLHTDGNIELEIKLTGILNLYLLDKEEPTGGFGTEVAPQIVAHYHQHLFSLRVDPMIDGQENSIVEQEIQALPEPTGSAENWAGNGFIAKTRVLQTTGEGVRDANPLAERSWTFVNENSKHYASGKPAGFKIMAAGAMPPLYAKHDSLTARRAPFSKHALWTIPYDDARRYPAGKYVPQTLDAPEDSIEKWVGEGKESIVNRDIVSYLTIGTTHIPRPEDFPVMPAETVRVMLKPVNFFSRNPCLDLPSTKDQKSVNANASVAASATNGHANGNGAACCA